MQDWGLGNRTILKIHETLKVKEAGRVRAQQNQIVDEFEEAIYTPPCVESLDSLLGNWENFVNLESSTFHPIVKAIIAHYQFEAIHPFADGNGRAGRILMVLQLVQDKIIPVPAFYISGYLKDHSTEYKELLLRVTKEGAWDEYLVFMLKGFRLQAIRTREIITNIRALKLHMKREMRKQLPKIYSTDLLNHLFNFPVTFTSGMEQELHISRTTAGKYLKILEKHGFLKKKKSGKYVLFANTALLRILFERPKEE
jgi:Fic family protein